MIELCSAFLISIKKTFCIEKGNTFIGKKRYIASNYEYSISSYPEHQARKQEVRVITILTSSASLWNRTDVMRSVLRRSKRLAKLLQTVSM